MTRATRDILRMISIIVLSAERRKASLVVGFCLGETAIIRNCSLSLGLAFLLAACAIAPQGSSSVRALGAPATIGNGTVAGYAEFEASGTVNAIGVVFSGHALANLPGAHSDGHHCFDLNKDGKSDLDAECAGWQEWVLERRGPPVAGHRTRCRRRQPCNRANCAAE